jgi:hypothetical protein
MGGGLMQLVAYGAQDIYLTGNPQITFFKVVYRRHTNFSMESIQQTWDGTSTGADGRCTATISRNGDLIYKMYLEVGGTTNNTTNPGANFIKDIELEIGGQRIVKHSGLWMETWSELTAENSAGITDHLLDCDSAPIVNLTKFQRTSGMGGIGGVTAKDQKSAFTVPLYFWFCRNPGLALPLIALQYHEVKVILDHVHHTVFTANPVNNLWVDYIYLDTDERRRFAQVSHEYLIDQVQEQPLAVNPNNDLNFNHPVKELIWTAAGAEKGSLNYTSLKSPVDASNITFYLKFNGHDRFAPRPLSYFARTQVYDYHSGYGGLNSTEANGIGQANDSIAVYSFALKPEEHQPSGTCNFSRIDNAQLVTNGTIQPNAVIFAVNYNVLRIMSGMGGLAYSN